MANRHRGEISAILDGRSWTFCLTLGALAELEDHFNASDLSELAVRLSSGILSAGDILAIMEAGLRGGGHILEREEVAEMRCEDGAAGYARIVADLLMATFAARQPESE